jgi:hypothetical protein
MRSGTVAERESEPQEPVAMTGSQCELCGVFTDQQVGDRTICLDCYEERSSCCEEFGGNDLWRGHEDM